jgi:hypothetical protein
LSKVLVAVVVTTVVLAMPALGAPQNDPLSVERIRTALQSSPAVLVTPAIPPLIGSARPLWGGLTLMQPDASRGEIIEVGVPAGALAMRAVHAVAAAHHRREERKAHEEVERALIDFGARPQQ